jgi:chromosome segregation ATPase
MVTRSGDLLPVRNEDVMNLIAPLLASALGALFGTCVGVLLMLRNLRPPMSEAEVTALKVRLETNQSTLDAHAGKIAELNGQVEQRESLIKRTAEQLDKTQQELDTALAEAKKEAAGRAAAEQRVQELFLQAASLTEQCSHLEIRAKDGSDLVVEKDKIIAEGKAQLDAANQKIDELATQLTRTAEAAAELKRAGEQEGARRLALEAEVLTSDQRTQQLMARVAELEAERSRFDIRLQEERQSAAKGMELLFLAQEKLARAFRPVNGSELANSTNGNGAQEKGGDAVPAAEPATAEVTHA